MRFTVTAFLLATLGASCIRSSASAPASPAAPLRLSHAWIVVTPGAPERTKLEQAGFRIAPTINRHDGQGTASVTVEFLNGFLELMYPDSTVPVSLGLEAAAEKFRQKSKWRESGYSPIGIVFDRTANVPFTLPFPTWKVSADWMGAGKFIEMMTPKEMPKAASLSISSHSAADRAAEEAVARDPTKNAMFMHLNGARRITAIRVICPDADLPPAASYLMGQKLLRFDVGARWLLDVTLDNGGQGVTKDLQPDLPLVIHY